MNQDTGHETSRDVNEESPERMTVPDTPAGAASVFGPRLELAERFAVWLSTAGLERGLMGPRERPRLWDRHILNCAAAQDAIADGERVVDIGSGAGLPGIALALARPDLTITLVEPLLRRVTFLQEVVDDLAIEVEIVRGRAEEKAIRKAVGGADVVTSRAVAPLAKLGGWSAPLLRPGGRMVALKGESAVDEVARDRVALSGMGFRNVEVMVVTAPDAEETRLVIGAMKDKMKGRGRASRTHGQTRQ